MAFCLFFYNVFLVQFFFFFFSSRRRHTRCREVSWARRCVQETVSTQSTWDICTTQNPSEFVDIHRFDSCTGICKIVQQYRVPELVGLNIQQLRVYITCIKQKEESRKKKKESKDALNGLVPVVI
eukprot:TRINITY_DN4710_c0_g1_i11.p3 TRINITY_DN4710_c0_g1~~TRINITY_DN4710_c0_g1_i11.p3  ORF type:complete len:125 (-),score=40.75 TRINITY_DN4710_c0_g1_i11:410-784(-)